MVAIRIIYHILRGLVFRTRTMISGMIGTLILKIECTKLGKGFQTNGIPYVRVSRTGKLVIGQDCRINSGDHHNVIGRQQRTILTVGKEANLTIGNRVGMSSTAIICHHKITIGDDVLIGGNVVIYDCDFHPLDANLRSTTNDHLTTSKKAPVTIGDRVFIGAHSTILKGATIGANSIVGSGSVVTNDIPENEIWAGNPAKKIKSI